MPGFERIGDDRRDFRAYIESTVRAMKNGSLTDGEERIESAFHALAKGLELEIGPDKTIQGSKLGKREVKALYKFTKKFIETHHVKVSENLLLDIEDVKHSGRFFLSALSSLENQIAEKAEIQSVESSKASINEMKAELSQAIKVNAAENIALEKKYRSQRRKALAICGGAIGLGVAVIASGFVGAGFAIAASIGIGAFAILGVCFGSLIATSLTTGGVIGGLRELVDIVKEKMLVYNLRSQIVQQNTLQSARIVALDVLNDEAKLKKFCEWHHVDPEQVTVNELMYAANFGYMDPSTLPPVSKEFRDLNAAYRYNNKSQYAVSGRWKSSSDYIEKFKACGLKDEPNTLLEVRYLDSRLGDRGVKGEHFWVYRRLVDRQKALQPVLEGEEAFNLDPMNAGLDPIGKELHFLKDKVYPKNKWQQFRLKVLERNEAMLQVYNSAIQNHLKSGGFERQKENDQRELDVDSVDYPEYAYLVKLDQNLYAGGYHLARLEELREQLKRGGDYA